MHTYGATCTSLSIVALIYSINTMATPIITLYTLCKLVVKIITRGDCHPCHGLHSTGVLSLLQSPQTGEE